MDYIFWGFVVYAIIATVVSVAFITRVHRERKPEPLPSVVLRPAPWASTIALGVAGQRIDAGMVVMRDHTGKLVPASAQQPVFGDETMSLGGQS